ncbi:hypothetical protein JMM61_02220 [Rhodovulum sulfidophilum]|uniref:hypothetical protein n=1 Tax=Rhodovulum sulfidophilum TaxID=35806 RepID=UPI0019257728|nr:hypothetical protein [Rhodovulum sulfidophilum]MBL3584194.1 hypothetical protein [Rhodovulum sulfidophilum]
MGQNVARLAASFASMALIGRLETARRDGTGRRHAVRFAGQFDGCHTVPAAVLKTYRFCLARNRCCINARAGGKPVGAICVEALGR